MNPTHLIFLIIFLLLSLADLRYRVVPGVEYVFMGAVLIAAPTNPWGVCAVVLAVAWGGLPVHQTSGRQVSWPNTLVLPLLFYPGAWPVLLTGSGVRKGLVGRGDLLAAGSLALVFPWPALILVLIGLEVWRRWWVRQSVRMVATSSCTSLPALPGMCLGIILYFGIEAISYGMFT